MSAARPTVVVMAKPPVPQRVKTRLITTLPERAAAAASTPMDGASALPMLNAQQAAEVHAAMLRCVLDRTATHLADLCGRFVLCYDLVLSEGVSDEIALDIVEPWDFIEQSTGDLGDRLGSAWSAIGDGPVMFLGADSPDVPPSLLRSAAAAAGRQSPTVAFGPVSDGGYWTLAATRRVDAVLREIDWGSKHVLEQSVEAVKPADAAVYMLERWHDVDEPADLAALMQRMEAATEPALVTLAAALSQACALP